MHTHTICLRVLNKYISVLYTNKSRWEEKKQSYLSENNEIIGQEQYDYACLSLDMITAQIAVLEFINKEMTMEVNDFLKMEEDTQCKKMR